MISHKGTKAQRFRFRYNSILIILASVLNLFAQYPTDLPDSLLNKDLIFIYVHGFAENRKVEPFKEKMQEFLHKYTVLNYDVFTYRWEKEPLDFLNPIDQWENSKKVADSSTVHFNNNIIRKLEEQEASYVIVGYSLGTQLVTKALERYGSNKLKYLKDIYFLASAQPEDIKPVIECLPDEKKITSYYSKYFDGALKISFRYQEDIAAGGEIGFQDTSLFNNYRTVCTHVHKGGPIQRDYANMASAIAMLTLYKENIFIEGEPLKYNVEMYVMDGEIQWNDIIQIDNILIQQNVNTYHYRAVEISDSGFRTRKAWGMDMHEVMKLAGIFLPPYNRILK